MVTKELNELSLEELWQLFPIKLVTHNEQWKDWYKEESRLLSELLHDVEIKKINHIGSTAIKGIWAKNIVDILIEVNSSDEIKIVKKVLQENKYLLMVETDKTLDLNKGYTKYGFAEKVFHIHVRIIGDNDELYFRDYMNENSKLAKEYEQLKLSLCKKYEHDRDGYTKAKTEFVTKYTQQAKTEFKNRLY